MNNIIIKTYVRVSIIISEYIVLILSSQPNIFFHTKSSNNFLSIFPTVPSCCVISSCKDKMYRFLENVSKLLNLV